MNEEEKAIERCKELIKPEHSNWIGISNQATIEIVLNLIDKQNKVIDEMAEELNKLKEKLQDETEGEEDCFIPDEYSSIDDCVKQKSCKDCIKEYFIRKVEEDVKNSNRK